MRLRPKKLPPVGGSGGWQGRWGRRGDEGQVKLAGPAGELAQLAFPPLFLKLAGTLLDVGLARLQLP